MATEQRLMHIDIASRLNVQPWDEKTTSKYIEEKTLENQIEINDKYYFTLIPSQIEDATFFNDIKKIANELIETRKIGGKVSEDYNKTIGLASSYDKQYYELSN